MRRRGLVLAVVPLVVGAAASVTAGASGWLPSSAPPFSLPALTLASLSAAASLALLLLRRLAPGGALDDPARIARAGGLALAGLGLAATLSAAIAGSRPPLAAAIVVTGLGLVVASTGAWHARWLERWFESVLEGRTSEWGIRPAAELDVPLDSLPALFRDGDAGTAILVRIEDHDRQPARLIPWARVPWSVPSRASPPPSDPSAAGPPVTEDIWRRISEDA